MAGGKVDIYKVNYHWEVNGKKSHDENSPSDVPFVAIPNGTAFSQAQLQTVITNNNVSKPGAPTIKLDNYHFICTAWQQ